MVGGRPIRACCTAALVSNGCLTVAAADMRMDGGSATISLN